MSLFIIEVPCFSSSIKWEKRGMGIERDRFELC